jgi:hypothetical protein
MHHGIGIKFQYLIMRELVFGEMPVQVLVHVKQNCTEKNW